MSSAPLSNNPAASSELTARYCKLFVDYKLAVQGAHFASGLAGGPAGPGGGGQPVWQWEGPGGIRAADRPPLLALLAAPRLPPELERYLQH